MSNASAAAVSNFVWCEKLKRRVPAFKCLVCECASCKKRSAAGGLEDAADILKRNGRYKEQFVMRRREAVKEMPDSRARVVDIAESARDVQDAPAPQAPQAPRAPEAPKENETGGDKGRGDKAGGAGMAGRAGKAGSGSGPAAGEEEERLFFIEEGRLRDISSDHYASSVVYRMEECFVVERRFVKPGDSGDIVYEGKKPSRKTTVPVLALQNGEHVVLSSWDELDQQPERLADVREVIGASPVKQVFILRKVL